MNSREQNIKNGAIAFAIVLAVVIISIMCIGIYSVFSLFIPGSDDNTTGESFYELYVGQKPDAIIIDNSVGQLTIKSGASFEVSGTNVLKNFSCKFKDGTLTVDNSSKKNIKLSETSKSTLIITVPQNTELELLDISTGAGNCTITDITTDKFNIETGAGNATVTKLISDKVTVEAGAGNIEFSSSSLNDLKFNCGVGNLDITDSDVSGKCEIECGVGNFNLKNSELAGDWEVDCGVGEFNLDLNGKLEDYEIDISSSVGKIKLNGKTYKEIDKLNKGADNSIKIDGGVGAITINID